MPGTNPQQSETISKSSEIVEDDHPACQSCRRRKLKCSREVPSCSQCSRLESPCVYQLTRQKPGMKSGAVEALNRRVEALEDLLRNNNSSLAQNALAPTTAGHSLYHVSQMLVKELQRIDKSPCTKTTAENPHAQHHGLSHDDISRKRKRQDGSPSHFHIPSPVPENQSCEKLPSQDVLSRIVEKYFAFLHPWIPFLHQRRFRDQIENRDQNPGTTCVLHAMVFATMRLLDTDEVDDIDIESQIRRSGDYVLLSAMSSPSIPHLQALTILAFDHNGSARASKAWSLVGSLTRTVEYLRLTIEPEQHQNHPLRRPLILIDDPKDWTEAEDRRRLFWNIFLLDRLCSLTTGWNTSLTSDDVRRKLPCDGWLWAREENCDTPYFGIWNKSAARMGNSIAYIPAHEADPETVRSPGTRQANYPVDTSKLGAFAYCIEATESLAQVTTYFLQQRVDFRDRQEVGSWLTRFKELDLRLVHWKMFLPQKWKDSNVSQDISLVEMDPNLTLAHITHNTSMILLHQHIAYPPPDWTGLVKLPSLCSAETCLLAAVETVSITQKYLRYTPTGLVNSQFALCAFVAGRILLVHWRFYNKDLLPEFFSIVECLKDMSQRWQGPRMNTATANAPVSLAGQYATHLEHMLQSLSADPKYYIHVLGYSRDDSHDSASLLPPLVLDSSSRRRKLQQTESIGGSTSSPNSITHPNRNIVRGNSIVRHPDDENFPSVSSLLAGSAHRATQPPEVWHQYNTQVPNNGHVDGMNYGPGPHDNESVDDELTAMSHILNTQPFMDMDRVITFEDANFNIDMSQWHDIQPLT